MRSPRWLIAAVLTLAAANILDVWETLTDAPLYADYPLPFPIILKVVYAGIWAIILLILAVNLLRRRTLALRWTAPLLTLYGLFGLIGQAAFVRADYGRGRLPFQIALTVIVLLPVWWVAIRRGWLNGEGKQTPDSSAA